MALILMVNYTKLAWIILGAIIAYNEFLVYYLHASKWPDLPINRGDGELIVLFVADPQIQGTIDSAL